MRYGIVDIGSNTINGAIYDVIDGKIKKLRNNIFPSYILRDTRGGKLRDEGVDAVAIAVRLCKDVFKEFECDKNFAFATEAVRNIKNTDQLLRRVYKKTGLHIYILTPEQETHYDFCGMMSEVSDSDGLGFDLGGGSCQLMAFENSALAQAKSMQIGSRAMKNHFVRGLIPTDGEIANIRNFVEKELSSMDGSYPYIYAMGGTAKRSYLIFKELAAKDDRIMSIENISELYEFLMGGGLRLPVFQEIVGDRLETIIPGLIVIETILRHFNASEIRILPCGVRDGFILDFAMKN